ncbi:MAG: hypothetical protein A2931_02535 [Candidatus Niyogibacteria bacterium RIFCSPLOWO2_01_FULL_45_48]|uniref:PKD domain-containing protein n=1 Tax=Candidatus Niyogibacteria bacterium RIFCSPLOWO2_01_FULL_45_48 TaxID=1801724 RepID=A0A1G2EYR9_9BACT|nr:MAG: hypothetical protein A2835_03095 [Candidatus Niyogibacteria bacterium RIFCSPHIGHO2_01_FULL_45_28]OGZ30964.1 MAG: hypothetical protein A2931_02535 [Candidatus Niyogibacteria bacterium RIFCSPLOWO2_01_FULL_45_48]
MKYQIFVLSLFLVFWAGFALAATSQFVFTTEQQTIEPNVVSEKITVQFRNTTGDPVSAGQTSCLQLVSSSPSGEFSSSSDNWNLVNVLTINSNWTSRSFYYLDPTEGAHTMTARVALKPAEEPRSCPSWPVEEWGVDFTAEQGISIGDAPSPSAESQSQSSSDDSGTITPTASAIKAEFGAKILGDDRITIVGAEVNLEAAVLDSSGKPVASDDFLWSFGDGAYARGRFASHAYNYLGKYIIFLNSSVSGVSFGDSITVSVIPNEVKISEVKPNDDGWVEIVNGSDFKIDISHWAVSNGREAFYFPKNTFIDAKTPLVITRDISGIKFFSSGGVFLLYPRGEVANELSYAGALRADESFHNVNGDARIGIESPSNGRFVARISKPAGQSPALTTPGVQKAGEKEERAPESQLAAVTAAGDLAEKNFWNSAWMWFAGALILGILSAVGYFVVKKKSSF